MEHERIVIKFDTKIPSFFCNLSNLHLFFFCYKYIFNFDLFIIALRKTWNMRELLLNLTQKFRVFFLQFVRFTSFLFLL